MNPEDLKRILDALGQADVREFSLQTSAFNLELRRGPQQFSAPTAPAAPSAPTGPAQPLPAAAEAPAPAPAPASAPQPEDTPAAPASAGKPMKSPIVGTFYAASSPDAAPYVKVGDSVKEGQVLCIIEAMKLMNEIEAESAGVVREILVKNGDPVEFGQVLFVLE